MDKTTQQAAKHLINGLTASAERYARVKARVPRDPQLASAGQRAELDKALADYANERSAIQRDIELLQHELAQQRTPPGSPNEAHDQPGGSVAYAR